MNYKFIVPLVLMIFVGLSCEKENVDDVEQYLAEGMVRFTGNQDAGACGWIIELDSLSLKPDSIPQDYRKDSMMVKLLYHETGGSYYCGILKDSLKEVHIDDILPLYYNLIELDEDQLAAMPYDYYEIDTAYIEGDLLHLHVYYNGGCANHVFGMGILPKSIGHESDPVHLQLMHDSNYDPCYLWQSMWLGFKLQKLQQPDRNHVTFILRKAPQFSSYYGEFTYYY